MYKEFYNFESKNLINDSIAPCHLLLEVGKVSLSKCKIYIDNELLTTLPDNKRIGKNNFIILKGQHFKIVGPKKMELYFAQKKELKVIAFGTCVADDFKFVNFYDYETPLTRSSFVALNYENGDDISYLDNYPFRQLRKSVNKEIINVIRRKEHDALLIDLVGERYDIGITNQDTCIPLIKEIVDFELPELKEIMKFNAPKRIELVKKGLEIIYNECTENGIKPFIVDFNPASKCQYHSGLISFSKAKKTIPKGFDVILQEYINFAEQLGYNIVKMEDKYEATIYHRWTPSPYHFEAPFYYDLYFKMNELFE